MTNPGPVRTQRDLADIIEMILDKGIVINADIVITVGETELLGVEVRAAIASFDTAAEYGLAFPSGTDMQQLEAASGRSSLEDENETVDLDIFSREDDEEGLSVGPRRVRKRPAPQAPFPREPDTGKTQHDQSEADESAEDDDEN